MKLFHSDGHLTDESLNALIKGTELPDLSRLEISEHLSYCDSCLERYAAMMTEEVLLSPKHSCEPRLKKRIRLHTAHLMANRYAAAAAAIIMMMAALWGSFRLPATGRPRIPAPQSHVTQQLSGWPKRWSEANKKTFSKLDKVWDFFDGNNTLPTTKGGRRR